MSPPSRSGARSPADAARSELLKSLSAAIKLFTLYRPSHPVPTEAADLAWKLLQRAHAEGGPDLAVGIVEGRWIVSGAALGEPSQPTEALAAMFRALRLRSVQFHPGVRLFEVTAFCRLAASAVAGSTGPLDPESYFKLAGVTHIRSDASAYSRVAADAKPAAPARVASPIPAACAAPLAAARFSGLSFGAFIKGLVDNAVSDPEERAKIYGETLSQVKSALDRRVSEATEAARRANRVISNELTRTEDVLSFMADGRVIVDRDGRVLMMDAVAEEISGKRLVDLAGKPIQQSIACGGTAISLSADLAVYADKEPSREMLMTGAPEVMAAIRNSTAVVQDEQGRIVGTYSVLPSTAKYEEAIRLQREFVSHVTHELNAPLSSICAALELLNEMAGPKLSGQEAHFIDVSLRNSRMLKQTISEILDFSKLQSGKMTVKPAATAAAGILREAAEGLRPWAVSKDLTIEVSADPDLEGLLVLADHGRVVQILTNLVSNAIKSTPSGGRIFLAAVAQTDARRAVFSVKDTGCGIPKEDQAKIFQRFTQGSPGRHRREGVGLGLTIAKDLVALHNGTMWLESERDKGSTFFFTLSLV